MDKEKQWKLARLGNISASELDCVISASGKITDANLDYIRKKRFERVHGFTLPVNGRALEKGKEQESYAMEWFRANHPDMPIVYSQDCDEIPFWKVSWAKFGASPDCFSADEKFVLEIKSVVSNANVEFFCDEATPYEDKYAAVLKEHGNQIAGQFLSNDKVQDIWLLKYVYQRDEVDEDIDSPLAPWRGTLFKFKRRDFPLKMIKDKIMLFDAVIDSNLDPKVFKKLKVVLDGKKLKIEE